MMTQLRLFAAGPELPEGAAYVPDLISPQEERRLIGQVATLPFRAFQFHGYEGKRRVVSFGWRYDFNDGALNRAEDMPAFLLPLKRAAEAFARLPAEALKHALVTEYAPGAGIGWHRDRPEFGRVVGVSLGSACRIRFRRRGVRGWERMSFLAEPRSAYLLAGAARSEWEHSIVGVPALRYSVTFRTLRDEA